MENGEKPVVKIKEQQLKAIVSCVMENKEKTPE
jgi:hypothetical protein